MKPIDINLSAQPYRNDTPLWAGLALVMASAVALTVYNGWHFTTSNQRIEALTSELAGHRQKMEAMSKENDKFLDANVKSILRFDPEAADAPSLRAEPVVAEELACRISSPDNETEIQSNVKPA